MKSDDHHEAPAKKQEDSHFLINKAFNEVIDQFKNKHKDTDFKKMSEGEKEKIYKTGLNEMRKALSNLVRKKQIADYSKKYEKDISETAIDHAETALKFYEDHVTPLNPLNTIAQLREIDYSRPVNIAKISKDKLLTQMQSSEQIETLPDDELRLGGFYTYGVLPTNFQERASSSGIGALSKNSDNSKATKAVSI